jgi:hypothetical protein
MSIFSYSVKFKPIRQSLKFIFLKKMRGLTENSNEWLKLKKKNWKIDTLNWHFLKSEYLIKKKNKTFSAARIWTWILNNRIAVVLQRISCYIFPCLHTYNKIVSRKIVIFNKKSKKFPMPEFEHGIPNQ